jgi:hypothetical protein
MSGKQSDQAKAANAAMRKMLGAKADEAAAPVTLRALPGGADAEGDGNEGDQAPWIELPGGGRMDRDFAHELGNLLAEKMIFRRESEVVTVNPETGACDVMSAEAFVTLAEDYCVPYIKRPVKGGTDNVPKSMSKAQASVVLASAAFRYRLRKITRVGWVTAPVIRADGSLQLLPEGYDEETGIFTLPSPVTVKEIELAQAVSYLRDLLKDFPFHDERSLAVQICAMCAAWGHGLQALTAARLGFVWTANSHRSGKSLLAQLAITPAYGLAEGQTMADRQELRKMLDAVALQGGPYVFFDNLTGHIQSEIVESFMTTPIWTGRVMGSQRIFKAPRSAVVFITGNNLTVSPDISERTLTCNLYLENFDPQDRTLGRIIDPITLATSAMRSDILSAIWAIMRHWDSAGRPWAGTPEKARRLAGFAEWSDIFGGMVQAAGFGNPLERPKDEQSPNSRDVHMRTLVELLANALGTDAMGEYEFQQIVDACYDNELFTWLFDGRVKKEENGEDWFELNSRSAGIFGLLLTNEMAAKKKGRIFGLKDGRRVRFSKRGEGRAKRYQVEILPETPPAA